MELLQPQISTTGTPKRRYKKSKMEKRCFNTVLYSAVGKEAILDYGVWNSGTFVKKRHNTIPKVNHKRWTISD
jgi:hypothetical protein